MDFLPKEEKRKGAGRKDAIVFATLRLCGRASLRFYFGGESTSSPGFSSRILLFLKRTLNGPGPAKMWLTCRQINPVASMSSRIKRRTGIRCPRR